MLTPQPLDILREVARHYRARVTAPIWPPFDPPSPDREYHYANVKINGRRFTLIATNRYISVDARAVRTSAYFAVNSDWQPSIGKKLPGGLGSRKLRVYAAPGIKRVPALEQPKLVRCIENLELEPNDGLHVANNWLRIYLTPRSVQRVLDVLNDIGPLIEQLPPEISEPETFTDLPGRFRELIPLLRVWSISDDTDRGNKLARASTESLNRLVKTVKPRFASINRYLDDVPKGEAESAAALGTLAECACEAIVFLEQRKRRRRKQR